MPPSKRRKTTRSRPLSNPPRPIWLDRLPSEVLLNIGHRLCSQHPRHSESTQTHLLYLLALTSPNLLLIVTELLQNTLHIRQSAFISNSFHRDFVSAFLPHLKILKIHTESLPFNISYFRCFLALPTLSDLSIPATTNLLKALVAAKHLDRLTLNFYTRMDSVCLLNAIQSTSPHHLSLHIRRRWAMRPLEDLVMDYVRIDNARDYTRRILPIRHALDSVTHLQVTSRDSDFDYFAWCFALNSPNLHSLSVCLPPHKSYLPLPSNISKLRFEQGNPLDTLMPYASLIFDLNCDLRSPTYHPVIPDPLSSFPHIEKLSIGIPNDLPTPLSVILAPVVRLTTLHIDWGHSSILENRESFKSLHAGELCNAVKHLPALRELVVHGARIPSCCIDELLCWFGARLRRFETPILGQEESPWQRMIRVLKVVLEKNQGLEFWGVDGIKDLGLAAGGERPMAVEFGDMKVVRRLLRGLEGRGVVNIGALARQVDRELKVLRGRLMDLYGANPLWDGTRAGVKQEVMLPEA